MKSAPLAILCLAAASMLGCEHMRKSDTSASMRSTETSSQVSTTNSTPPEVTGPNRSKVFLLDETTQSGYIKDDGVMSDSTSSSSRPEVGDFTAEQALRARGIGSNDATTPKGTVRIDPNEP